MLQDQLNGAVRQEANFKIKVRAGATDPGGKHCVSNHAEGWHLKLGPSASRRLFGSAAARDWPQLGCCPPASAAGGHLAGAAAGQVSAGSCRA